MAPERGWSPKLALVFAVGLALRLLVVAWGPSFHHTQDAAEYERIAQNVVRGAGFSSAAPGDTLWHPLSWRAPGYPLFIAAHYALLGHPARRAVYVTQAVLDAATAPLVTAIGLRLFAPEVALLAGLLYAIHPLPALWVATLGTEALIAFLLTLSTLLTYRAFERPSFRRGAAAGLVFGLGLLVRPTPQLFAPVTLALLFSPRLSGVPAADPRPDRSGFRPRAAAAIAFTLAIALTIAPWAWRNYRVHHTFIPFSTLGGVVLYEGVGSIRVGDWWSMPGFQSIPAEDWVRWRELGEVQGEHYMRAQAVEVIRAHPGLYLMSAGAKLARFWLQVSAGYGRLSWRSWATAAIQGLSIALALLAFLRHRGPWIARGRLCWLLVLYHSALYALTVAEVRYSYVLLPYVLLPGALSLSWLAGRRGGKGSAILAPNDTPAL
jgi:4-amino-4-deoxy-L-arabinose transferase-like glycosyltransferase